MEFLPLKLLILSPVIIGMLLLLPIFSSYYVFVRRFAKFFAGTHFAYSLLFLIFFNTNLHSNYDTEIMFFSGHWLGSLGINLNFGLDFISLYLIILTSFLFLIACVASKGIIKSKHSLYYALIFILETAVLGVFSTKDMFAFFMFWELELVPVYFLISLWGSDNAKKSAMKFLLFTFIGSLFMLLGFLLLYNFNFISTGELTANLDYLNFDYESAPMYLQIVASLLIFFGFAIKLPVVPLHTWLPDAHTDAPTPVSMLLAGILLKMGGYGIIRFNIQLFPDAFLIIMPYIAVMAVLGIFFGGLAAFNQADIKKIIAYSSISTMGIVLLGLCSLNSIGMTGAYYLMLAHGIISAGLFYAVGIIYRRTGTRNITQIQGLSAVMPRFASFTIILCLASAGLPGLMAFPGEFMAIYGAYSSSVLNNYFIQILAILSLIVILLSVCYILRFFHSIFWGNLIERWTRTRDLAYHEFFVLFCSVILVVIFGIFPMTITDNVIIPIENIINSYGG